MKKKIITVSILVFVLSLVLVLPSFALSDRWAEFHVQGSSWYGDMVVSNGSGVHNALEVVKTVKGTLNSSTNQYFYPTSSLLIDGDYSGSVFALFDNTPYNFPIETGDAIKVHSGSIDCSLSGSGNYFAGYRFIFLDSDYRFIASSDWLYPVGYDASHTASGGFTLRWGELSMRMREDGYIDHWGIQIAGNFKYTGFFFIGRPNFYVGYGNEQWYNGVGNTNENPVGQAIVGNNYENPTINSGISQYESAEDALIASQANGLNALSNSTSYLDVSSFRSGLLFLTASINGIVGRNAWLDTLIHFGIALGLAGFVLGVAQFFRSK